MVPFSRGTFRGTAQSVPLNGAARAEANVKEAWTFYRLPKERHKHFTSTSVLERLNHEIKRLVSPVLDLLAGSLPGSGLGHRGGPKLALHVLPDSMTMARRTPPLGLTPIAQKTWLRTFWKEVAMGQPARFGSGDDLFATGGRFWAARELGAGESWRWRTPCSHVEPREGLGRCMGWSSSWLNRGG